MTLLDDLLHLFFPISAVAASSMLWRVMNFFVWHAVTNAQSTQHHCERENEGLERLAGRLPLRHGASVFRFTPEGKVQQLIHLIKYKGHRKAAERVGAAYGAIINGGHFPTDPILIPVPLHTQKQRERGYNQSLHFAMGLSATSTWKVASDLLTRTRYTKTQTAMSREDRLANLDGAFALSAAEKTRDRDIILVDDILTTGATLEACAMPLIGHCASISFITIGLAV